MTNVTGGDLLVQGLEVLGAEVVFGLPGVHNLPAWRSLAGSTVRLVGVRHEQTAAYAADGYARSSGRLGVALVTTGPGAANTLAAVGEAWASGSPVLVIATDIPAALRREGVHRGVLHEATDQAGMFRPVTKAVAFARDPAEMRAAVIEAGRVALAAPSRPVYLEVPTDVLGAVVDGTPAGDHLPPPEPGPPPDDDLNAAVDLLAGARQPLIWAGGGAVRADAAPALAALAERLAAPVLTTYGGRGLLPAGHPCEVGLPPHVPEAGALWDEADVVLSVGSDLDGVQTQNWAQPQPPTLVTVNVDPEDAAKNYEVAVSVEGDAREVCELLEERLVEREPAVEIASLRPAAIERLRADHPDEVAMLEAFETALPSDAVLVVDMCIPGYWLAGFHRPPAPRRLQVPLGWGTLGYAFPAALGAALAGSAPVVAVAGDGGVLFALGEMATMAQEQIPLTLVIVDDGGYGMLRFDQRQAGDPLFGVDLQTPDFVALAASFGIRAQAVDGLSGEFTEALAAHVADSAPSVLVARAALDPPPNTSPRWYRRP